MINRTTAQVQYLFPDPESATEEGLVAIGGDLSAGRLIAAYSAGIFPWFSEDEPLLWWSPDPRLVLVPEQTKVSKSMKQVLRSSRFQVTLDQDFSAVIRACRHIDRPDQEGTWITKDMVHAYEALHQAGYAHSVEVWEQQELVGGLYGVSLGKAFFGESMFSRVNNASKTALIVLSQVLQEHQFDVIDCQVPTDHLERMGAERWPRQQFLQTLNETLTHPDQVGSWEDWLK